MRVQDPRVQNDGSWNSFVDYKIFLHVSIDGESGGLRRVRAREPLVSGLLRRPLTRVPMCCWWQEVSGVGLCSVGGGGALFLTAPSCDSKLSKRGSWAPVPVHSAVREAF